MRNWILGGLLACVTSAGVAYVLAKNATGSHCGLCIEKPVSFETVQKEPVMGRCDAYDQEPACPHCKPSRDSGVVDVVDLDRSYRMADGTPKPVVSFEEPPLAKPRGEVVPVKFETPAAVEELPMPREVNEQSRSNELPTPHYLKHYPEYFSPDPEFPLQKERDSMLDQNGDIRRGK